MTTRRGWLGGVRGEETHGVLPQSTAWVRGAGLGPGVPSSTAAGRSGPAWSLGVCSGWRLCRPDVWPSIRAGMSTSPQLPADRRPHAARPCPRPQSQPPPPTGGPLALGGRASAGSALAHCRSSEFPSCRPGQRRAPSVSGLAADSEPDASPRRGLGRLLPSPAPSQPSAAATRLSCGRLLGHSVFRPSGRAGLTVPVTGHKFLIMTKSRSSFFPSVNHASDPVSETSA